MNRATPDMENELAPIKAILQELRAEGNVLIAILYGSFFNGTPHARSDVDLALYVHAANEEQEIGIIDRVLMSSDREISILRLDDEDESPFIVQEALKGKHLVEPEKETLYRVYDRALHESEHIRVRRNMRGR
jgi:predicted nucleotidyltransferase